MDKYEFNVKVEQIKKLVMKEDFTTAMKIADTIDWHRVRNANLLAMISQVYEKNGEYQEAKEVLLQAYERAPVGKRLLFKLTELALREGSVHEAKDYYKDFCEVAPGDPRQNLLRYLILKSEGATVEQLIPVLERYVSTEMDEQWMYELAELYSRAGRADDCVRLCDRMMLMFGLGKYVDKARELKIQYAPLTDYQVDLAENKEKYEAKLKAVEEEFSRGPLDMLMDDDRGYGYPEEEAYPEMREYPADDEVPITPASDEELVANYHQVRAEENLAQEVSRIAYEDQGNKRVVIDAPTKPLYDIRRSNLTAAAAREEEPQIEVEEIREEAVSCHLAIEARTPEKGLQIAVEALKKYHLDHNIHHQVLKITGSKLNSRGIMNVADKLRGRDLIVEEAGDLSEEEIGNLSELIAEDASGMVVVLVDNPLQMEELYQKNPEFLQMFEHMDAEHAGGDSSQENENRQIEENGPGAPKEEAEPESAASETPVQTVQEQKEAAGRPERAEQEPEEAEPEAAVPVTEAQEAKETEYESEARKTEEEEYEPEAREAEEAEYEPEEQEPEEELAEAGAAEPEEDAYEEEMDADAFAEYACQYASQIDCSILGKSMLALYERVELMEEDGIPLTRANAEELIEEAADKAEKPSLSRLITGVFSPKYDKNGLLILRETHFI